MKVYIAGPFFDEDQLSVIDRIEEELDKADIEYFSPRSEGVLKDMAPEDRAEAQLAIFKSNVKNMRGCDAAIIVIDNFDPGSMFEFGFVYHRLLSSSSISTRSIVTLSTHNYGLNVMLQQAAGCHLLDPAYIGIVFQRLELGKDISVFNQRPEDAVT